MIKIFRRHSARVLPIVDTNVFTDIRPHPSPPHASGWKPMKVFPLMTDETDKQKEIRPFLRGLYTPFVSNVITQGDLQTLSGLLCNPFTKITPTSEMATSAVRHGHLHIVRFLHHYFGVLPTEEARKLALIRQDFETLSFIKTWSNRKRFGLWKTKN